MDDNFLTVNEANEEAEAKKPDYIGLSLEDKLVVQKSKPIFDLVNTDMTLLEFKLLDAYLGKIDSNDCTKRMVRFTKTELENALGQELKDYKYVDKEKNDKSVTLEQKFNRLLDRKVEIEVERGGTKRTETVNLFERSIIWKDDSGTYQIDLECTPSATSILFNLKKGYMPYLFNNIAKIKRKQSYILFLYLKRMESYAKWQKLESYRCKFTVSELRKILQADKTSYIKEFKIFNAQVIKKSVDELKELGIIDFDYETVKTGRSVTHVAFTVYLKSKDKALETNLDENNVKYLKWLFNSHLTEKQIEDILEVCKRYDINEPSKDTAFQDLYLNLVGEKCKKQENGENIINVGAYFLKMLNNSLDPDSKTADYYLWFSDKERSQIKPYDEY